MNLGEISVRPLTAQEQAWYDNGDWKNRPMLEDWNHAETANAKREESRRVMDKMLNYNAKL